MLCLGRVEMLCLDCKCFFKGSKSVLKNDPMKITCPECNSKLVFGIIPK